MKNIINILFFGFILGTMTTNYFKNIVGVEPLYLMIGSGLFFTLLAIKKGIKPIIFFSIKCTVLWAFIMSIIPAGIIKVMNYDYLNLMAIFVSFALVAVGFSKIKSMIESGFIYLLSLFKSGYDLKYNNIKKDNARIKVDLNDIDNLGNNGRDFEDFIARIYRSMGFISKTTTQLKEENDLPACIMKRSGNGEQGADVLVFFGSPISIKGKLVDGLIIQCKQYSIKNKVENSAVQEVVGAIKMYEQHFLKKLHPVVITNSYLTGPALDLAKANDTIIIDRDGLPSLIKDANESINKLKDSMVA